MRSNLRLAKKKKNSFTLQNEVLLEICEIPNSTISRKLKP